MSGWGHFVAVNFFEERGFAHGAGGDHLAVEGDGAVFDGFDEVFVLLPFEVAELLDVAELLAGGGFVGAEDEFRAVDFVVVEFVADVVGFAEVLAGVGDHGGDWNGVFEAIDGDGLAAAAVNVFAEGCFADGADGFEDEPGVVLLDEDADVGVGGVGAVFYGVDEFGFAWEGLEDEVAFARGVAGGDGGRATDEEKGEEEEGGEFVHGLTSRDYAAMYVWRRRKSYARFYMGNPLGTIRGMKRAMNILALGVLAAAMWGCNERKITIVSDPPGAIVHLNDVEVGRTPVTVPFTWYGNYDVRLRLERNEGTADKPVVKRYYTHETRLAEAPAHEWVGLDLFSELMPMQFKDEKVWAFVLKPVEEVPTEVLIQRAKELKGRAGEESDAKPKPRD